MLVDTPPKADSDLRPALREAALVIVPVSISQVDLWATEGVLDLAERERRPALVVLNRTRAGTRLTGEIAEKAEAMPGDLATARLGNRVAFAEAMGQGLGVQEMSARSAAALEIAALSDEIRAMVAD